MFARFAQSWSLVRPAPGPASDKELLLFPLLSAIASLIVAASFFVPAMLGGMFTSMREDGRPDVAVYALLFAFYVVQYFVIIFFNSALVGAAMIRLRGGDPTVADGFRIAMSKLPAIPGYAVISATVGVFPRALQERAGFIGRFVVGLIGLADGRLVPRRAGARQQRRRSDRCGQAQCRAAEEDLGQNLIGNVGIGPCRLPAVRDGPRRWRSAVLAATTKTTMLIVLAAAVVGISILLLVLVQAALQGIYSAALYRYAAEGEAGGGFARDMVADAFRVKA